MTAPVASGWSLGRVGFQPTGKRRLFTAHTQSGVQAQLLAEKIRARLSNTYLLTVGQDSTESIVAEHRCSASLGGVVFIGTETTQDDVIRAADAAMYQAKEVGRNSIWLHAPIADQMSASKG